MNSWPHSRPTPSISLDLSNHMAPCLQHLDYHSSLVLRFRLGGPIQFQAVWHRACWVMLRNLLGLHLDLELTWMLPLNLSEVATLTKYGTSRRRGTPNNNQSHHNPAPHNHLLLYHPTINHGTLPYTTQCLPTTNLMSPSNQWCLATNLLDQPHPTHLCNQQCLQPANILCQWRSQVTTQGSSHRRSHPCIPI